MSRTRASGSVTYHTDAAMSVRAFSLSEPPTATSALPLPKRLGTAMPSISQTWLFSP